MTDTAEKTRTEKATEPAKRWRNWWRATAGFRDTSGRWIDEGYVGTQIGEWPSRELAEQAATDFLIKNAMSFGKNLSEYLGAYPEGQKP